MGAKGAGRGIGEVVAQDQSARDPKARSDSEVEVGEGFGVEMGVEEHGAGDSVACRRLILRGERSGAQRCSRRRGRLTMRALAALTMPLFALPAVRAAEEAPLRRPPRAAPAPAPAHRAVRLLGGATGTSRPPRAPWPGRTSVERILDGCAFRESWKAADGSEATSLDQLRRARRSLDAGLRRQPGHGADPRGAR